VTIEQAIKTAIAFELEVRHVYADAAKKFKDPVARKFFGVLADEEDRHVQYLECRLAEWQATGAVTAAALGTAIPAQAAIAAALGKLSKRMSEQDFGVELEMLKKALALEIQATTFFNQVVAELSGEEQALFARFVEIEIGHEAIVQAEIDSITGLGFWFDYTEYRFDGA
jgi:rubrerythrin